MKKFVFAMFASFAVLAGQVQAAFDLQVTEIWPGTGNGDDHTSDWFEITNVGDMPWVAATDGELYFDDESANVFEEEEDDSNPGTFITVQVASFMGGIDSIAPGESVIYVDEAVSTDSSDAAIFLWETTWVQPIQDAGLTSPRLGFYDGSGLSGSGGDAVTLFIDADLDGIDQDDFISRTAYPSNLGNLGKSYDTVVGAYTTANFPGVVSAPNDENIVAIATPGYLVPEPSSVVLVLMAGLAGLPQRKRN